MGPDNFFSSDASHQRLNSDLPFTFPTHLMDYVLPNELVDGMIAAGGKKSTVSVKNLLLRGFYSGSVSYTHLTLPTNREV